jgi:hypothetical protein
MHSVVPRYTALGLAGLLVAIGVWLIVTGRGKVQEARQTLVSRRDTLMGDLQQLELKRRAGTLSAERYTARRQRIVAELEQIYGELDETGGGPQGGGEGVAA